jgi:hypothetical protein
MEMGFDGVGVAIDATELNPTALRPNQRLHLTPRLGHRGRDRFCYRCWLLAITQSFRGAGEPRSVRQRVLRTRTSWKENQSRKEVGEVWGRELCQTRL